MASALRWLKQHNFLYKSIEFEESDFGTTSSNEFRDVENVLQLSEEESAEFSEALRTVSEGVSTNPHTVAMDPDIMLLRPPSSTCPEADVRDCLHPDSSNNTVIPEVVRQRPTDFSHPMTDPYFYEKCFPHLWPYGRGGPGDHLNGEGHCMDADTHAKVMLHRGFDRRWQQYPPYYFTAYAHSVQRKVGGMVATALRETVNADGEPANYAEMDEEDAADGEEIHGQTDYARGDPTLTAGNVQALLDGTSTAGIKINDPAVKSILGRLVPYARSVPGSNLHIRYERNKLLAILSSHAVRNEGHLSWFLSSASAEPEHDDIFRIIAGTDNPITSKSTSEEREAVLDVVDTYCAGARRQLLGMHPALAVRLFVIKMDALWTHVLCGSHQPLGFVQDIWRRIEFQRRLVPHEHAVVWVARNHAATKLPGSMHWEEQTALSENLKENEAAALRWCDRTITCKLLNRLPNDNSDIKAHENREEVQVREADETWMPERGQYFEAGPNHPCRAPFSCKPSADDANQSPLDFRLGPNGLPVDERVHIKLRRCQLCSQMHKCMFTCWKYNSPGDFKCRFEGDQWGSPVHFHPKAILHEDRDRKGRVRVRVLPGRNNTRINKTYVSPLVPLALQGANHDIQLVDNAYGAAIYSCSYAAKAEAPDEVIFAACLGKKLASLLADGRLTAHERTKAVANAFVGATQVGSIQVRDTHCLKCKMLHMPIYT